MTNNIYPPDHLLRKWESLIIDEEQNVDVVLYEAFQAGADQELEACINYFHEYDPSWGEASELITGLRDARRPKPPSLKEQALDQLRSIQVDLTRCGMGISVELIRRALESLPS